MSGARSPANRSPGHALVIAHETTRATLSGALQAVGYTCDFADDPYVAILHLCRSPSTQAVVIGLGGVFREELAFIEAVKRRFPATEIWLTQTDGRAAALAEAMRLGGDALLGDDGLYRVSAQQPVIPAGWASKPVSSPPWTPISASSSSSSASTSSMPSPPAVEASDSVDEPSTHEVTVDEPVLTADELRALLHEPHGYSADPD